MDTRKPTAGLSQACYGFAIEGTYKDCVPYGNGHINRYLSSDLSAECQEHAYILQHMNKTIFTDPESLMENIIGVTGFLKEKIKAAVVIHREKLWILSLPPMVSPIIRTVSENTGAPTITLTMYMHWIR